MGEGGANATGRGLLQRKERKVLGKRGTDGKLVISALRGASIHGATHVLMGLIVQDVADRLESHSQHGCTGDEIASGRAGVDFRISNRKVGGIGKVCAVIFSLF